jgi:dolichyl-diphosphooligosaccharide--protein glycosyltransferase
MKEKKMLNIKKYKMDILWIVLILLLTFGIRFSPLVLKDYSQSYNKVFADANYVPYTNDPGDSYYYARRIQDFAEGKNAPQPLSKAGADSKMITLSKQRDESWTRNLFPIIGAFFAKVFGIFGITDLLLIGTIYVSFLIGVSSVILYLFVKNRTNRFGGVVAAVLLSCGTPVLANTNWGHCDTDGILILLPLAMIFSFYKSLEEENRKGRVLWSAVSCLSYAMICFSWTSYNVYYILFLGVACATLFGTLIFKGVFPKGIRPVILIQLLVNTLFSLIIDGKRFVQGLLNLFISTSDGIGNGAEGYPSASKYIGELLKLSWVSTEIEQIFDTTVGTNINMLGGAAVILLGLFTAIVLIIICFRNRKTEEEKFRTMGLQAMIFIPWLIATVVMLFQGRRFLEYILMPLSVLVGFGLGYLVNYIRKNELNFVSSIIIYGMCLIVVVGTFLSSELILGVSSFVVILLCAGIGRNKYKGILIFLLAGALIVTPVNGAYKLSKSYQPGITSIYYDTADWIKKNTPKDALIASWWDYGYFYQCYGERATIGHGGVFDGQYFYWLGRGLLTSDYKLSAGIFRMLGNGGLTAQSILTEVINNPEKECEALGKILPVSKEEAKRILIDQYNIPKERAEEVVSKTHPSDGKPIYLAITQDMFAKMQVIAYYGTWDFKGNSEGYYYVTSTISRHVEAGETAPVNVMGNGTNIGKVAYAIDSEGIVTPHVYSRDDKEIRMDRYILIENGKVVKDKKAKNAKSAIVVFKENDSYSSICCNSDFCDSVMFRLFYTDAAEQKTYEKVFTTEISNDIFGDHSMIQHRICCPGLRTYLGSAGVYQIK